VRRLNLNQRPFPHPRTVPGRLLPFRQALHQLRPERKDPASDWFRRQRAPGHPGGPWRLHAGFPERDPPGRADLWHNYGICGQPLSFPMNCSR
jgi:hypothetical protein